LSLSFRITPASFAPQSASTRMLSPGFPLPCSSPLQVIDRASYRSDIALGMEPSSRHGEAPSAGVPARGRTDTK